MISIALTFKLFADGVKFTNIHGWDLEGSGKLYEVALARIQIGTAITHTILFNQCFWNAQVRNMVIHFLMIVLIVALHVVGKRHRKTKLESIVRIIDRMPFQVPSVRDKANWIYRYSHPYFRAKGVMETFRLMNQINSPLSLEARIFNRMREPKRFNMPFTVESPTKYSNGSPTHHEGVEGSEFPGNGHTAPSINENHLAQVNVEPQQPCNLIHLPSLQSNPVKSMILNIEPPRESARKGSEDGENPPVSPRLQILPIGSPQPDDKRSMQASHFRKDFVDLDPFMDCNSDESEFELNDPAPLPKVRLPHQGPLNGRRLSKVPEIRANPETPLADVEAGGRDGGLDVAEERSAKFNRNNFHIPKQKLHVYTGNNYLAPLGISEIELGDKAKSNQNLINGNRRDLGHENHSRFTKGLSGSVRDINITQEKSPTIKLERKKPKKPSGMDVTDNTEFNELRESKGFLVPEARRMSETEIMLPQTGNIAKKTDRNISGPENTTHN